MRRLNWIYRVYPKQDIDRPLRAKAIRTAGSDAEEPRNAAATSVALLIELGTVLSIRFHGSSNFMVL